MTEREQRRLVRHRLSVCQHAEEVTGNVSQTCRYCGISRHTFSKWLRSSRPGRRRGETAHRAGRY